MVWCKRIFYLKLKLKVIKKVILYYKAYYKDSGIT